MTRQRRILSAAVALLALAALLAWAFMPRPLPVEVATARIAPFEIGIEEDARTRVRDRYLISAPLGGQLARIALREGDAVAANDVVATLSPTESPLLDARTLQAQAARVEGADAVMARADTRIQAARIALRQAENTLRRSEQLAKDAFVSATQLENQRLATEAARAELASAEQDRHVAEHELEQARAALASVRGRGDGGFEVRTPVAGRVLRVLQPSAGTVAVGTPLLEIGDTGSIEVVAELLTGDALRAAPGARVRIGRWGGEGELEGRVRLVEPSAFTKVSALGIEEQRVNVLVDILDQRERWQALGDGYRVGVRIIVLERPQALQVPVSAVFPGEGEDPKQMAVFAVREGRAHRLPVRVAGRNGSEAWIESGLEAGTQVILYPGAGIADGVRVRVRQVPVATN